MPAPGAQCRIYGPERAAIGWKARVDYAWSRDTVHGIVNAVMVQGLTRKSCKRRAARAVARFHAQEGAPPRAWTKEECEEILEGEIVRGMPPAEPMKEAGS
jgi:hypothetical protein